MLEVVTIGFVAIKLFFIKTCMVTKGFADYSSQKVVLLSVAFE